MRIKNKINQKQSYLPLAMLSTHTAIYIRVSTNYQINNGYGSEAQKTLCEKYANNKDLSNITFYNEQISGTVKFADRPVGGELLGKMKNSIYSNVIFYTVDRIGRDIMDILSIDKLAKSNGVILHEVRNNIDSKNPIWPSMIITLANYAELERKMIIERTTLGRNERGKIDGEMGGNLPYGYTRGKCGIEVNPGEAILVRRIFELRDNGYSLRKTESVLESEGFVGRNGKRLIFTQIQRILKYQEVYSGELVRNDNLNNVCYPKLL